MVFGNLFLKILERGQGTFAGLDFVQNDQRLSREYPLAEMTLEVTEYPTRFEVILEERCNPSIRLQIHVDDIPEAFCTEPTHQPGLPDLTCALQDQ